MAYYSYKSTPLEQWKLPAIDRPQFTWGEDTGKDVLNPGTILRQQQIATKLKELGGQYTPKLKQIASDTKAATAGYGGFKWGKDDPNTPQDESLDVDYEKGIFGDRERSAVNQVRWGANARGMLYSSFTDSNVGDAVNNVADEARGVISQYGRQVNDTIDTYFKEGTGLLDELGGLYGQDMAYYANPDAPWAKAPPLPEAPVYQAPASASPASAELGPWKMRPSINPAMFNIYQRAGKWYATRR